MGWRRVAAEFDLPPWQAHRVVLALQSDDGDQGYPGDLEVICRYEVDGPSLTNPRQQLQLETDLLNELKA